MSKLSKMIDKGVNYLKDDPAEYRYKEEAPEGVEVNITRREERTQINTGLRVLFVKPGCEQCADWKDVVEEANIYLPPKARIRVIDAFSKHPLLKNMEVTAFPTLYIDGIEVAGTSTEAGAAGFIKGLLANEMRYGEVNPNDYIR